MRHAAAVLFLLALAAPAAWAQAPPRAPRPEPPPGAPPGPPPGPRGAEVAETVEIFMLHKMREALGLTDEQSLQVLDAFEARREGKREGHERRREAGERLERLIHDPATPDSAFLSAIREMEDLEALERKREEEFQRKLASILTPRQRAQFFFFRRRIEEEIRRRIEGIREMRPGAMAPEERRRRLEEWRRERGEDAPPPPGGGR